MRSVIARRFRHWIVAGASILAGASIVAASGAQTTAEGETIRALQRALAKLPYYSVFDDLAFELDQQGVVTLNGSTYTPRLRIAAEKVAKRTAGVKEVANRLDVLPPSQEDERIRWATFYRVYTDAFLSRYASGGEFGARREFFEARRFPGVYQPLGRYAIHIVVKHGRTALTGMVDSDADRTIAEMRAREVFGVFAVDNQLAVRGGEDDATE